MIKDFDNYLDFLESQYEKKNRNFCFSYEYMAKKLGIGSRSHMYRLFKGYRKMTPVFAIRLCKLLGINDNETDYFITLLLLSEAETEVEKDFLHKKKNHLYQQLIYENKANSSFKIKQMKHTINKRAE